MGIDHQIWSRLLPQDPIVLVGRVPEKDSAKYLAASRLSMSKDLVIVAFTPGPESGGDDAVTKDMFEKLFDFHASRG